MMTKFVIKSILSVILILAILFSFSACSIFEIKNKVEREAEKDVHAESATIYEDQKWEMPLSVSASKEEYISNYYPEISVMAPPLFDEKVPNGTDSVETTEQKVEELVSEGVALSDAEATEFGEYLHAFYRESTFSLAVECIAYDAYACGYEVFQALALVDGVTVPGLAFTNYNVYQETEERTIYSCGFLQLTESGVDADIAITREDVDRGVVVVPNGEYDTRIGFVVSLEIALPSYSGIYHENYFRYDQISDYTVSVAIQDNDRSLWDEDIDLYNFTENKYVFKGDLGYRSMSAFPYFSDEAKAYAAARDAVDQIIAYQESNAYRAETQAIIIFTEDVLDEYLLNRQQGSINGFLLEKINEIKLEANQFVVVTTEGVTVETVVDTDAQAKARLTNGILGLIGSALMVAGSVFVTVVTCGAGAPLAVGAICAVAGAGATLYGISQMAESAQEIYYGAKGDIYSESFNPVLSAFKAAIPDDELATKIYHIWGISSSIVQALVVPANAALTLSRVAKATVWQTTIAVTRAVVVEAVKMAVTGLVSAGVGYGSNVIVTNLTGDENWGKVAGFGSALLTGAFTYKGLNKLDSKFNFSGLHTKVDIITGKENQVIKKYKDNDPNTSADEYQALDKKFVSTSKTRHEVKNEWFKENHKGEEWYKVYEDGYIVENGKNIKYSRHYFEKADGSEQIDIKFYKGRVSNK